MRLRVLIALVHSQDRQAVPALIDLVAELPLTQTAAAQELLRRLAGANAPAFPPTDDAAARDELRSLAGMVECQRRHGEHGSV